MSSAAAKLVSYAMLMRVVEEAEVRAAEALQELIDADQSFMNPADRSRWFAAVERGCKTIRALAKARSADAARGDDETPEPQSKPQKAPPASTQKPNPVPTSPSVRSAEAGRPPKKPDAVSVASPRADSRVKSVASAPAVPKGKPPAGLFVSPASALQSVGLAPATRTSRA